MKIKISLTYKFIFLRLYKGRENDNKAYAADAVL